MHQLYKQGKIWAIGVSNYSLEQMNVFRRLAPLHTAQPPYKSDPKFQPPRYAQYLKAVERLDQQNYGKRVLELAVRWTLDQLFVTVALWGACHPDQLAPIADVGGWKLDSAALKAINENVRKSITDPVGSEFLAPPARSEQNREKVMQCSG